MIQDWTYYLAVPSGVEVVLEVDSSDGRYSERLLVARCEVLRMVSDGIFRWCDVEAEADGDGSDWCVFSRTMKPRTRVIWYAVSV
jgi:hypothetical protein